MIQYDEKQLEAIDLCCDLTKRIVAVTGEAGTGKTTIIKEVYARLLKYIEDNKDKFYVENTDALTHRLKGILGYVDKVFETDEEMFEEE